MSYILDALKKAEEERRRHTESDGQDGQKEMSTPPRRRKIWPYLIFFALLANTVLFVWWTEPWKAGTTVSVQKKSGEKLSRTMPEISAGFDTMTSFNNESPESTHPLSPETKPSVKDAESIPPDSAQREKIATGTLKENIHEKVDRQDLTKTTPTIHTRKAAVPSNLPPDNQKELPPVNRIYALEELPSSVLHDLPDMSISLLYYTEDPKSRLISMKDKTLREGSELVPGLKLLGIDSDSAIFGYRNYLFRVAVNAR